MLKEKTAIITGASRGIGKAIAIKLASLGADIVLNYNSSDIAANEVIEIIKEYGVKVKGFKADVSKMEEAENLFNYCKEEFGGADILINNAGITRDNLLLRMSENDFDDVIRVNLKGSFNCMKLATPVMLKKKWGRIINIASVIGITGNAGQINYAAAKAGIIGMTKSLAKEISAKGITVNAIAPGFIDTDMTSKLNEKTKEEILKSIPMKKMGLPSDIANTVAFLSSDDAEYITGHTICVDGGLAI